LAAIRDGFGELLQACGRHTASLRDAVSTSDECYNATAKGVDMRFSLKWFFGFVGLTALALALAITGEPWVRTALCVTVWLILVIALVVAANGDGPRRTFASGFSITAFAYLLATFAAPQYFNGPAVLVNSMMRPIHARIATVRAARLAELASPGFTPVQIDESTIQIGPQMVYAIWADGNLKLTEMSGHMIATILLGCCGGWFALFVGKRVERRQAITVDKAELAKA
jgi:hypothetical protein